MKAYRIYIKANKCYLSSSSLQSTKDKWLSLLSEELLNSRLKLFNMEDIATQEINITNLQDCEVGSMEFGIGDTYRLSSVNAKIIHQTNKYIYACRVDDDDNLLLSTTEKYKRSEIGTIDFKTAKGIRLK